MNYEEQRWMVCPVCEHRELTALARIACGPHRSADGTYSPAVDMLPEHKTKTLERKEVDHGKTC